MAKYSYEFKKQIVKEYLAENGGAKYIADQYGIKLKRSVQQWVEVYKEFGGGRLERSPKNKNYTFEFKITVVELYITTEISYQALALSVGMNNQALITRWVNDYHIARPDALREKILEIRSEHKDLVIVEYMVNLENRV